MMSANKLSISFHDFDAHGDCCADITLPVSGTVISGFKVKPGMGGGIQVHMPAVMETTWPYPAEIEWAEVRKLITAHQRTCLHRRPKYQTAGSRKIQYQKETL